MIPKCLTQPSAQPSISPWAFSLPTIALLMFLPITPLRAQAVPEPLNAELLKPGPLNAVGLEEVPEEVLRQEMIFEARSPLNGAPLTATEYAELQADIEQLNQVTPQVSPKLQQLMMLVKLRKFIKTVLPIVPIK